MQGSVPCCGWHPRAQPTSNMSEHALQQISVDGRDTCTQANLLNRNGCRWRDPYDNEADVGLVMQRNGSQTDGHEARHADNNRKQSRRVFQTRRPRVCNCVLEPKVAHATVFCDVLYQQCTYHNVQDEDNEAGVGLVMQRNGAQTDGQEARHADTNRKQSRRVFQTRRPRVCNCVLEPKVAHATVFWDVLYKQCTYHNVQDETCQRMHVEQHVGCTRMRARVECSGTLPYHPVD